LKDKLARLEEVQVKSTDKKLASLGVVTQVQQYSREVMEGLNSLIASLGKSVAASLGHQEGRPPSLAN
jgi:hypothetical protein